MNKLTAEVARRELSSLKRYLGSETSWLSLREERYLQALEIALPVLEQQEKGKSDWIDWKGGECPVQGNPAVEVRLMNGTVSSAWLAKGWVWEHGVLSPGADIIAYRVIGQQRGEE